MTTQRNLEGARWYYVFIYFLYQHERDLNKLLCICSFLEENWHTQKKSLIYLFSRSLINDSHSV